MKGIFKKTLACAIAACALTSSVTAFAANGLQPDEDYYSWNPNYEFWAKSVPSITKYNNEFDFEIKASVPCDLELRWNLFQESTGRKIGNEQKESMPDSQLLSWFDSAPLAQWGNVRAKCKHYAYWNATIVNMTTEVTTLL